MKKELHIKGMSCQNCVRHVKEALAEVAFISILDVDLKKGIVTVDAPEDSDLSLSEAIKKTNYTLKKIK